MDLTHIRRRFTKELLNELLERDKASLIEEYNTINSKSKIKFKCHCGEEGSKSFSIMPSIGIFCHTCTSKRMLEKTKVHNLKKFGCEDPNQLDSLKKSIKDIHLSKYGVDSPMKVKEIKEKQISSIIEKYGFKNVFQNPSIKEKSKNTLLLKYGVEYPLQLKEFQDKFKSTLMERFGVEVPYHSDELKQRGKDTCLKVYGVENALQSPAVRQKGIDTNIKKYGVEYRCQDKEYQEHLQQKSKHYKTYKMPSGEIRKVQGYEPFALNDLLKTYTEEQIITSRKYVPRISYKSKDKIKYYFPDIYIPSINMIIEVKSSWTYTCKTSNIQEKKDAVKEAGYKYEIWVYDAKGNKEVK